MHQGSKNLFRALAWGMLALGVGVAAGFPLFVLLLGVPASIALQPSFFAATLIAGLVLGLLNFGLASRIVRPRLRRLRERMQQVRGAMERATFSGDWSECDPDACRIDESSGDELGALAETYNALLHALHAAHRIEDDIRQFNEALSSRLDPQELGDKALSLLQDIAGAQAGAVALVRGGGWSILASRGLEQAEQILQAPGFTAAQQAGRQTRITLPPEVAVNAVLGNFAPRDVLLEPITHHGIVLGWLILASASHFSDQVPRLLPLLIPGLALGLNNALLHDDLQRVAALDPLTGVFNRRFGLRRLDEELARAERSRTPLALLILDLDHFKRVNDTFGHLAGDRALTQVANLCRGALREGDVLLRYGGEEFMVILPGASLHDARQVAERIRFAVAQSNIEIGDQTLHLSVSIGVAASTGQAPVAAEKFIDQADARLYAAKQLGRNRVVAEAVPGRAAAMAAAPLSAAAGLAVPA